MAPRARRAASAEERKQDSDDEASGARRKSRTKSLPTYAAGRQLRASEEWKVCLKDKAYAAGKTWMEMVKRSEAMDPVGDPHPDVDDSKDRRELWERRSSQTP